MSASGSALRPFHWATVLLAALSLSIGWGIRGNFGHEYGAMLPGALTAIAVCLLSGRADWRERVAYFGMFGALGWGFGGSISYMKVVSFTHSGHLPSQVYGFLGLFLIGFLWAGLGGAGTALPAVIDRDRLTKLFVPLAWIFVFWLILTLVYEPVIEGWATQYDPTWSRHGNPFYWFDSDWLQAVVALLAVACFDLYDRRGERWYLLLAFAAAGAFIGWGIQQIYLLALASPTFGSAAQSLLGFLVQYQADMEYVAANNIPKESLVINWPQFFIIIPQHVGWILGLALGLVVYFCRYGKFRYGASLFAFMAAGWLLSFIVFPTLLGFGGAGFRMTPPRGDDWAGILGVFIGAMIWLWRNKLRAVTAAGMISGIIGGLGFSGAVCLKLIMLARGNPARVEIPSPDLSQLPIDPAALQALGTPVDPAALRGLATEAGVAIDPDLLAQVQEVFTWHHWQSANWHSFLEQSYGFINGLAIAVAVGILALKMGRTDDKTSNRRWTQVFAVAFVLLAIPFLNLRKNPESWVGQGTVAEFMRMPLVAYVNLSAIAWFHILVAIAAAAVLILLIRHQRSPLPLVPATWLGRGQLLYLVLLWAMVIGNFERALPGFAAGRLITEGVIFINACTATLLIVLAPKTSGVEMPEYIPFDLRRLLRRTAAAGVAAVLFTGVVMTGTVRALYGNNHAGHSNLELRFGPDAEWRIEPLRKDKKHA
jgi:hypothetical protein